VPARPAQAIDGRDQAIAGQARRDDLAQPRELPVTNATRLCATCMRRSGRPAPVPASRRGPSPKRPYDSADPVPPTLSRSKRRLRRLPSAHPDRKCATRGMRVRGECASRRSTSLARLGFCEWNSGMRKACGMSQGRVARLPLPAVRRSAWPISPGGLVRSIPTRRGRGIQRARKKASLMLLFWSGMSRSDRA
jgi:hypothetical protein